MADFFETVFLGGGISCLSAARAFSGDYLLIAREERVGGLGRSDRVDGFTFDRTGHLLHLARPRTKKLIGGLLRGKLVSRLRDAWIYSHGVYTRYPFQSHFFGLPPEAAAECLEGVFEAHYRPPPKKSRGRGRPQSFHGWVLERFGRGVARHFLFPYNHKLWTVPPRSLTTEWIGRFVPRPDLRDVVLGALYDRPGEEGYNARFWYPKRGGIETLVRALSLGVERTLCSTAVRRIDLVKRSLLLGSGDRIRFGRLVSCAPLKELVGMIRPLPDRIRRAATRLRAASVYNLNLGIRDRGETRHWVYVPEDRFALYRFGFSSNFAPSMAPPGAAAVYTEVAYSRTRPLDRGAVRRRVLGDLEAIGVIQSARDVLVEHPLDLKVAYAIYDRHRTRSVKTIRTYLEQRGIHPIGRYGRWEYCSMEDAISHGLDLAANTLKP